MILFVPTTWKSGLRRLPFGIRHHNLPSPTYLIVGGNNCAMTNSGTDGRRWNRRCQSCQVSIVRRATANRLALASVGSLRKYCFKPTETFSPNDGGETL